MDRLLATLPDSWSEIDSTPDTDALPDVAHSFSSILGFEFGVGMDTPDEPRRLTLQTRPHTARKFGDSKFYPYIRQHCAPRQGWSPSPKINRATWRSR